MRIIKLGLISFIFFGLLITGISLFFPSHIRISKAINVKAHPDSVLAPVKDAARWNSWYPGIDSAKPLYVEGKIKGLVFDDSNPTKPVYIVVTEEKKDEITAQFISPKLRPVINGWKMTTYTSSDSITLQWYMDFSLHWYPWEKFSSLMFEKSYGSRMEQGLTRLKALLEK